MSDGQEQHAPRDDATARAETAPEPQETAPRGNMLSEPEMDAPGDCPAPHPH